MLSFEKRIGEKKLKVIALPEIQETSDVPCDVGSDVSALRKEIEEKNLPVDIELVPEGWNDKVSRILYGFDLVISSLETNPFLTYVLDSGKVVCECKIS